MGKYQEMLSRGAYVVDDIRSPVMAAAVSARQGNGT